MPETRHDLGPGQEAEESILWLELLRDDCGIPSNQLNWLLAEANELIAIFVTMCKKVKARLAQPA
jgi:hypothetical protein